MRTWYERAKAVMAATGVTQGMLSEALGIAQPTVSAKLSGRRDASSSEVATFAQALGVDPGWLAYGAGLPPECLAVRCVDLGGGLGCSEVEPHQYGKTPTPYLAQTLPINLSSHPDLVDIPRVKFKLSAGVTGFAIEQDQGSGPPIFFRRDFFSENGYRPDSLFAVRVTGSSMEPSLWEGDLVVINTKDAIPSDGEPFALNYEGELVIKRLKRDAGEWWATSDNPDQRRFSPKRCNEDVKIIGKAVYKQSSKI